MHNHTRFADADKSNSYQSCSYLDWLRSLDAEDCLLHILEAMRSAVGISSEADHWLLHLMYLEQEEGLKHDGWFPYEVVLRRAGRNNDDGLNELVRRKIVETKSQGNPTTRYIRIDHRRLIHAYAFKPRVKEYREYVTKVQADNNHKHNAS